MKKYNYKRGGFTLIELLVVISIIALLMAILMPALAGVRRQAKTVVCMVHLRQWGAVFAMYTGDNNDYFQKGWVDDPGGYAGGHKWPITLMPYYKNPKIRFCPMATKSLTEEHDRAFSAWVEPDLSGPMEAPPGAHYPPHGSYGLNEWVGNPDIDKGPGSRHRFKENSWRSATVKGAANIPLMLDCCWAGAFPLHTDSAPEFENDIYLSDDEIRRFCIKRHDKRINGVFVDFSVRKIGLKQLWKFKWHKNFNTNGGPVKGLPWPAGWPDWMKDFRDY